MVIEQVVSEMRDRMDNAGQRLQSASNYLGAFFVLSIIDLLLVALIPVILWQMWYRIMIISIGIFSAILFGIAIGKLGEAGELLTSKKSEYNNSTEEISWSEALRNPLRERKGDK